VTQPPQQPSLVLGCVIWGHCMLQVRA
jgi:hypothetical protein